MSHAAAVALQAHLTRELGDAAEVTLDPVAASAALVTGGRPVVLIPAPAITHLSSGVSECEWSLLVLVPERDALTSWPKLDAIAERVATATLAERTHYASFQPPHGQPWPCAVVTTTT